MNYSNGTNYTSYCLQHDHCTPIYYTPIIKLLLYPYNHTPILLHPYIALLFSYTPIIFYPFIKILFHSTPTITLLFYFTPTITLLFYYTPTITRLFYFINNLSTLTASCIYQFYHYTVYACSYHSTILFCINRCRYKRTRTSTVL